MKTVKWHLIIYDVCCPKRGQRLYRLLKSCAFALQHSSFAWQGTQQQLQQLQKQIIACINEKEDDVRGYIIKQPLLLLGASPFIQDCYFQGYPPHKLLLLKQLPTAAGEKTKPEVN